MDWFSLHFSHATPADSELLLHCQHDPLLVLLALIIAFVATYAAFGLSDRVLAASNLKTRLIWSGLGGLSLGGGIWAMHFIAMLALKAPIAVTYHLGITLLSLVFAVIGAFISLWQIGKRNPQQLNLLLGSIFAGMGISSMHYTGMMAMESQATISYNPWLFTSSILVAIASTFFAIRLSTHTRGLQGHRQTFLRVIASALLVGAIGSMHFIGMFALEMTVPVGTTLEVQNSDDALQLGVTVALISALFIAIVWGTSYADRTIKAKEMIIARSNSLIKQLDRAQDSLQHLANYDHLTNFLNRRAFNKNVDRKIGEHDSVPQQYSLLSFDLDNFKRINDTLGHEAGDELLKIISSRLKAMLDPFDVIARSGGDEFAIFKAINSETEAGDLGHRFLQKIKEPLLVKGRSIVMTSSIGIALFPRDGNTAEDLIKNADLALYQAKSKGRNTYHAYDAELRSKASLELQLEEDLRNAITNNQLSVYYQPLLDIRTGHIVKLEALVRWQHPQHGFLSPDRFIPLAEINGLISQLDSWVFQRACRDIKILQDSGYGNIKVAVNCSAINLNNENLPTRIANILREESVDPRSVELEVTENALMGNISKAATILQRIREFGVGVSIDDFGTGYSSLSYLKSLPIHTLKVDRSFIKDIPSSNDDMEITAAIIAMAHKLQLRVVAEGVECIEQITFLRNNHCDIVQGYFISRPLAFDDLERFLSQHRASTYGTNKELA